MVCHSASVFFCLSLILSLSVCFGTACHFISEEKEDDDEEEEDKEEEEEDEEEEAEEEEEEEEGKEEEEEEEEEEEREKKNQPQSSTLSLISRRKTCRRLGLGSNVKIEVVLGGATWPHCI